MPDTYRLDPALRIALGEIGLSIDNVCKRACLPVDLLRREAPSVSAEGFFRLWQAIGDEAGSITVGLRLGKVGAIEGFSPALMAALASPNLIVAANRIAHYKNLFAPLTMQVVSEGDIVTLSVKGKGYPVPMTLAVTELMFWVSFVRRATRERINPTHATLVEHPNEPGMIEEALGIRIHATEIVSISFDKTDAERPFITTDSEAWRFYEPVLENRLAELESNASTADRIHVTLVELLPSGRTSLDEVSEMLAYTPRSLQRLLQREGTSFKKVLANTRERLAKHYLCSANITHSEVAFLLGYDDPNSFFRAFRTWTGTTPERFRLDNLPE